MRVSTAPTITRVVLHNPNAGSTWRAQRTLRVLEVFRALPGTVVLPTRRGSTTEQIQKLITADTIEVFACGGDGTVSDVAAGLVGTDIRLGIIPCGTTNTLAYEFGVPRDPLRAVHALISSNATRSLRIWSVGEHHLILGVGVGWDARLMWRTPSAVKRRLGYFALTPIGVALAMIYDFPEISVDGVGIDGVRVSATGTSVLVANARHWAGYRPVFPDADPANDLLDVIILERRSRIHLFNFWLHMMLPIGSPLCLSGIRVLKLHHLTITSNQPEGVEAHVNGDPVARTPLVIDPAGTVRVIVPAPTAQ